MTFFCWWVDAGVECTFEECAAGADILCERSLRSVCRALNSSSNLSLRDFNIDSFSVRKMVTSIQNILCSLFSRADTHTKSHVWNSKEWESKAWILQAVNGSCCMRILPNLSYVGRYCYWWDYNKSCHSVVTETNIFLESCIVTLVCETWEPWVLAVKCS